ncbi:unnamed protein product [Mytilus coruscus]|uniref:BTB domain-containing protein n=1 Tax=Mytilus coruscus TaxID=42192 RepID=A0A6J8F1F2_MYTCO|nr:unnamed protein product [Mytilus coruscus]
MSRYMKAEKKTIFKNVHDFIIRPLLRQRQTGELCDITLIINGKKFSAHRSILGLWSPYFLSMFTCQMREKSLEEIDLTESLVLDDDDVDETVLIYLPGKPALVLDEVRYKWITSLRKVPSLELTKYADAYGFDLHVATNNGIFVLENDAPFTTSMYEINETFPHPIVHIPPPIDNLSLVAAGCLSSQDLNGLELFDKYDECYANALHVTMKLSEPETEDSGTSPSDRDSENDFEYDEDIYDYDYDLTGEYGF